ncbi:hypothetical protein BSKO_00158 [Bryopsis sp. KO-2023]|nr:hypothetical protein BSKO_00158 [Bryopsis sp. KO-2023]
MPPYKNSHEQAKMVKRKTLAEEVAELTQVGTADEAHYEDELDADPKLVGSDGEDSEGVQDAPAKGKGSRHLSLKADIVMNGKEYAGKKSSRASIFEQRSDSDSESESSDIGNLEEIEEMEEDGNQLNENGVGGSGSDGGDISGHSMGDLESLSEEDGVDGAPETLNAEDDLDLEFNQLQSEDPCGVSSIRQRAIADREKGTAVQKQKKNWERWLGIRIMLQKCLDGANRMPSLQGLHEKDDSDLGKSIQSTRESAWATMRELLALQTEVVQSTPQIPSRKRRRIEEQENGRNHLDTLWEDIDAEFNAFSDFRDVSLDRYHRQAMLQSGAAQRSSLKILQQGVSAQVSALLRAPHRLVARSRLPLAKVETNDGPGAEEENGEEGVTQKRDPETYDDSQFYQQLLKEFLEGKGMGSVAIDAAVKKQRKKHGRKHQPCKDRMLRYTVHEKLVNFMTPVDFEPPAIATQMFRNLFGHRG